MRSYPREQQYSLAGYTVGSPAVHHRFTTRLTATAQLSGAMTASTRLLLVVALAYTAGCLAATNFVVEYTPDQLAEIQAQLQLRGYTVVRQYPSFNRLIVSGGNLAATASTDGSFNSSDLAKQVSIELKGLGGVEGVSEGGVRHLFPQPVISDTYSNDSSAADGVCSDADGKLGPDGDLGRTTEGVPYGIKMVQADDPGMIEISKKFNSKVLFCVIDTGLDRTNTEFNNASTSGCIPGFPDDDVSKPYRYCYTWYEDANKHGTHTSGTIAAMRNGQGVVGVSAEGAQVYHYNYFGPNMDASDDLEVAAWQECIAELDRRKAATKTPDMKLVISMSYGSYIETNFSKAAIKSLAKQRSDVLWIAAAGNSGDNSTNYPAGYEEVISIGAVDWDRKPADFSTYNADVELSAPGVQTLSTIPNAFANGSDYYFRPYSRDILSTSPALAEVTADSQFLNKPKVSKVEGGPTGNVTAGVVFCGLATETCGDAEGKICLIQRGENTFCTKIMNCVTGGGVGVILYNRDDVAECDRLSGVSVDICESKPEAGWPLVITTSRKQGQALRTALQANPDLKATINVADVQPKTDHGLEMLSGTSMATPTAAGVAGLIWSAHTKCSSAEIRAALIKTAMKPDNSTGRDQHYGYGIVQAKAAHDYLTANPCGSKLKVSLTTRVRNTTSSTANSSNGLPANPTASRATVLVTLTDSNNGQRVAGQQVQLIVMPSRKVVRCNSYQLTTNSKGMAVTSCQFPQGVKARFIARAASAFATAAVQSPEASS